MSTGRHTAAVPDVNTMLAKMMKGTAAAPPESDQAAVPAGPLSPVATPSAASPSRRRLSTAKPLATAAGEGRRKARSVRVDRDVEQLVALARATRGASYLALVMRALEEHHAEAASLPGAPRPPVSTGLFAQHDRRPAATRTQLISLHLTDDETEIIDGVAERASAAAGQTITRSELVSRVLRAHLSRRVFCPLQGMAELSALGDPASALRTWVEEAAATGVPAPAAATALAETSHWVELPAAWVESCAEALEAARVSMTADSWSQVVWAAVRRRTR